MSAAKHGRHGPQAQVTELVDRADRALDDAERLMASLQTLADAHRALLPYGTQVDAESAREKLSSLFSACSEAQDRLVAAHNACESAVARAREHSRGGSVSFDCGGAPGADDLLSGRDHLRLASARARRHRTEAIHRARLILVALLDGIDTSRKVAARSGEQIFTALARQLGDDVPIDWYRRMSRLTSRPEHNAVVLDLMITLADMSEEERRRYANDGLRRLTRVGLVARIRRFLGREPHLFDDIAGAALEED